MKINLVRLFIGISGGAAVCLLIVYNVLTSPPKIPLLVDTKCQLSSINQTKILNSLQHLLSAVNENKGLPFLRTKLQEIIQMVVTHDDSINVTLATDENESDVHPLEVCPEVWYGAKDRPYFYTGWKIVNCTTALPFHTLLSILLYPSPETVNDCSEYINNVVVGLNNSYSKVPIVVANIKDFCKDANVPPQVQFVPINILPPGQIWNNLIEAATTPYILIGRHVDSFMWFPNLERSVNVISYNPKAIEIAGGAFRNRSGHWRIGCLQSSMRNYILEYKEGYYKSKNECMFCDYLMGPFVAKSDLLKEFPFDQELPEEVLFEDFFLTIKQMSRPVVNCPDVMYFASDVAIEIKLTNSSLWLPLAYKWQLNRIVVPNAQVFSYSCIESGLTCSQTYDLTNSYLIPICCLEQFATAVAHLDDFCRFHKIPYEFEAGSILGIVKVGGLMPWDLDGDCTFFNGNLSIFENRKKEFTPYHINLDSFVLDKTGSYFKLHTPDMYIEMIGEPKMSYDDPRAEIFRRVPTQALLHGRWVFVQPSPGLYSRNRYGLEMLRHTHSWLQLGMKGWAPYKSGYFQKCKNPKHHACLDHFSTDGNLQFYIPN